MIVLSSIKLTKSAENHSPEVEGALVYNAGMEFSRGIEVGLNQRRNDTWQIFVGKIIHFFGWIRAFYNIMCILRFVVETSSMESLKVGLCMRCKSCFSAYTTTLSTLEGLSNFTFLLIKFSITLL